MHKPRFTESQIIDILVHVPEATYYLWKSKYNGMEASDITVNHGTSGQRQ